MAINADKPHHWKADTRASVKLNQWFIRRRTFESSGRVLFSDCLSFVRTFAEYSAPSLGLFRFTPFLGFYAEQSSAHRIVIRNGQDGCNDARCKIVLRQS